MISVKVKYKPALEMIKRLTDTHGVCLKINIFPVDLKLFKRPPQKFLNGLESILFN